MSSPINEDVVVAALLALGGDLDPVHIEDIAVKADEIAPGRFRWQKHTQHINIQTVYKALKDARARGHARGKSASGWMLTDEGLKSAHSHERTFGIEYQEPISRQDRAWLVKERKRLTTETAYIKFLSGAEREITHRDALRFFMLDDYVTGDLRKARIERLVRLFGSDAVLSNAVQRIAEKVPQ